MGGSGMRVEGGGACAACSKLCARLMFKLAYQMALCQGPCTTLGLWLMRGKEWVCGVGAVDGTVQDPGPSFSARAETKHARQALTNLHFVPDPIVSCDFQKMPPSERVRRCTQGPIRQSHM